MLLSLIVCKTLHALASSYVADLFISLMLNLSCRNLGSASSGQRFVLTYQKACSFRALSHAGPLQSYLEDLSISYILF